MKARGLLTFGGLTLSLCLAHGSRDLNEVLAGVAMAKEQATAQPVQGHTSLISISQAKPIHPPKVLDSPPAFTSTMPNAARGKSFLLNFAPGSEVDWAITTDQYWVHTSSVEEFFDGRRALHAEGGKLYLVTDHTILESLETPMRSGYRVPGMMVRHLLLPESIGAPYVFLGNRGMWVYDALQQAPPQTIQKLPSGERLLSWAVSSKDGGTYSSQLTLDPSRDWMVTHLVTRYGRSGKYAREEESEVKILAASQVDGLWLPTEVQMSDQFSGFKGVSVRRVLFKNLEDHGPTDAFSRIAHPGDIVRDSTGFPVFRVSDQGDLVLLAKRPQPAQISLTDYWKRVGIGVSVLIVLILLASWWRRKATK